MSPVLPTRTCFVLPHAMIAAVFLAGSSLAAGTPERPETNLEILAGLLQNLRTVKVGAGPIREIESLRFSPDDPSLLEAARTVREIADVTERIINDEPGQASAWLRSGYLERMRQRARELETGIITVPPVWDAGRLREGWIVTAEVRHDIDGDGADELFVGIKEGGVHPLSWTCCALGYERRRNEWHLVWEEAYEIFGYPSKGVYRIDLRDFDGDGRDEVVVGVNIECFGNGGGGGCWVEKVYRWDGRRQPPAAKILEFPRKSFGTYWRGEEHYEEICARETIQGLNADGSPDVLIQYEAKETDGSSVDFYADDSSVLDVGPRRLLREERWLWHEGGYVLDTEALLADFYGCLEQARRASPQEGLALCARIESDFWKDRWVGDGTMILDGQYQPPFEDLYFVRGELALRAGQVDGAFEDFDQLARWRKLRGSIAARVDIFRRLGGICEELFEAPREAAEYYGRALSHGATQEDLAAKVEALRARAQSEGVRPIRPGELAGVSPNELRTAGRAVIASNWHWLVTESWMPGGRGIVFCGRKARGDTTGVYLADVFGEEPRRLCDGRYAVPYGREGAILVAQAVETPEGKTGWRLVVLSPDGTSGPRPGPPPTWVDGLVVSPDARHVVLVRARCGAENFGYELSLASGDAEPRVIRCRSGILSLCRILGWRSDSELVVDLDEGTMIYDVTEDAWRRSDPVQLGEGSYGRRLSPAGTHIAYFGRDCIQAWGGFLWLAKSDGSEQSQPDLGWRCRTVWRHGDPRWSPGGTRLLLVTAEPENGHETTGRTLSVLTLGRRVERTGE